MTKGWLRIGVAAGAVILLAAACGSDDDGGGNLAGTTWSLERIEGVPAEVDSGATLVFGDEGELSGNTGCNTFSGRWSTDGDSLTLDLGRITLAACADPALQLQESSYLAALDGVASFGRVDGTLTLFAGSGDELIVLSEVSTDLAGTSWRAVFVNDGNEAVVSVLTGVDVTAELADDGTISGSGGCNTYTGSWRTEATSIEIRDLSITEISCGADIDAQEIAFIAALANSTIFVPTGRNLDLRDDSGARQVLFERAAGS